MATRVYKKKLLSVVSVIGLITAIACGLLFATLFIYFNGSVYSKGIRNIATAKTESSKLSLDVIWEAHTSCSESDNIRLWGFSELESNDYYFYSVRLYQEISRFSSSTQDIDYEIAVTRLNDDSFVVMQSGTVTKDMYFNTVVPKQAFDEIKERLAAKGIIPVISDDGNIKSILLYSKTLSDAVVITSVPTSSLCNPNDDYSLVINGEHFYTSNKKHDIPSDFINEMILNNISESKYNNTLIYVVNSNISSLKFVFYFPALPNNIIHLILISILALIIWL